MPLPVAAVVGIALKGLGKALMKNKTVQKKVAATIKTESKITLS